MTELVWVLIFMGVVGFGMFVRRMTRQTDDANEHDTGLAIMEFGRAFPTEPIRQVHSTASGDAVFVRLYDNKAGFMRNMRNHFACHLIEPGTVRVTPLANGKGVHVEFLDAPFHNGDYTFSSTGEAAEVSLWLLGNYIADGDRPDRAAPAASA